MKSPSIIRISFEEENTEAFISRLVLTPVHIPQNTDRISN